MKNSNYLSLGFLLFVIISFHPSSTQAQEVENEKEFDYARGSHMGPEKWGDIKKEWSLCSNGTMQSPIDMSSQRVEMVLNSKKLYRNYMPCNATVKNRGHDIMLMKISKWIPAKVNIFIWRLGLGRIPTIDALRIRKCDLGSSMCDLCGNEEETSDHLFCGCELATEVWLRVSKWCKCPPIFLFSKKDILDIHRWGNLGRNKKKIMKGVASITAWHIWLARNKAKFNNTKDVARKIVQDIMMFSFLCYTNRGGNRLTTWEDWRSFEFCN